MANQEQEQLFRVLVANVGVLNIPPEFASSLDKVGTWRQALDKKLVDLNWQRRAFLLQDAERPRSL